MASFRAIFLLLATGPISNALRLPSVLDIFGSQQPLHSEIEASTGLLGSLQSHEQVPTERPPTSDQGQWLGWGADIYNNHWASSDATTDSSNADKLQVVCEKKYAIGVSAAPLVVDGVAYYPTFSGLLVALDYKACTELWTLNITNVIYKYKPLRDPYTTLILPSSRTTPVTDGEVLYLGTLANALFLAVDQKTGRLLDALQLSDHPAGIITQSATFYKDRIFVGTSSMEELTADAIDDYECCSFMGTINGLSFSNGRLRLDWTQNMVPPGSGFSGAAVWGSQPSIDPIREQVFVATGNVYSIPEEYEECQNQTAKIKVIQQGNTTDPCTPRTVYQESVLAFNIQTGRINWARQLSPLDAWNVGCFFGNNPAACPANAGPDADFGMAPTFVLGSTYTPYGEDTLIVGQKNGNLYALSAQAGSLFWATATSPDGIEGGLIWGVAVDDKAVYYTAVNSLRVEFTLPNGRNISNSAFGASSLKTGETLWQTAVPDNATSLVPPAVVNDVVLTGATGPYTPLIHPEGSGSFVTLDKYTGKILKKYPLQSPYQGAPAAVHEYVMFGSGYYQPTRTGSGRFHVWKSS